MKFIIILACSGTDSNICCSKEVHSTSVPEQTVKRTGNIDVSVESGVREKYLSGSNVMIEIRTAERGKTLNHAKVYESNVQEHNNRYAI